MANAIVFDTFLGRLDSVDGKQCAVAIFDGSYVPTAGDELIDDLTGEGGATRQTFDASWDTATQTLNVAEADEWPTFPDSDGETVVWAVVALDESGDDDDGKVISAIPYTSHTAADGWYFAPLNGFAAATNGQNFETRLATLEALEALPTPTTGDSGKVVVVAGTEDGYTLADPGETLVAGSDGASGQSWATDGSDTDWESMATEVTLDPGSTTSGLTFANWADLYTYASDLPSNARLTVQVADDYTIPSGTYSLLPRFVRFVGPGADWFLGGPTLTVADGVTFPNLEVLGITDGLLFNSESTATLISSSASFLVLAAYNGGTISTETAAIVTATGSGQYVILDCNGGRFTNGVAPDSTGSPTIDSGAYELVNAGANSDNIVILVQKGDGPSCSDDLVRGTAAYFGEIIYSTSSHGASAQSNLTASLSASTINPSSAYMKHTQADAADWTVATGATVAAHLDEIGARVTDIEGGASGILASTFNAKGDILSASADDTPAILSVGSDGQHLVADSGETTGLNWATPSADVTLATFTTKGDVVAATASATVSRLGVGTNGQVLTADSGEATGLKWATPSSGGGTAHQQASFQWGVPGVYFRNTNQTAQAANAYDIYAMPFRVEKAISVATVKIEVTTLQASSNTQLVIYATGSDGQPTSVVGNSSNLSCATTGVKSWSTGGLSLAAGTYALGFANDNAGIVYRACEWVGPGCAWIDSSGGAYVRYGLLDSTPSASIAFAGTDTFDTHAFTVATTNLPFPTIFMSWTTP